MYADEEREWEREAEILKKLDEDGRVRAVAEIRRLALGTNKQPMAEQHARFLENSLGLKKWRLSP